MVEFEARTDKVVMGGMWQATEGENGGVLSWTKKDKERGVAHLGRENQKFQFGPVEHESSSSEVEVVGGHRSLELRKGGLGWRSTSESCETDRPHIGGLGYKFWVRPSWLEEFVLLTLILPCSLSTTLDKHLASSQHISKPWGLFSKLALGPFIKKLECKHIPSLHNLLATQPQDWGRCQQ